MTSSADFGSDESTVRFLDFYDKQLSLLEELYQYQFHELDHLPDRRVASLYPLLFSMHSTGLSVRLLAMHRYLNECFMLSRALLERLINYVYLLFCDEKDYSSYLAYTKQKGFRILNRSVTAGDLKAELRWLGSIDLSKEPELKQAVELFTSKKGRQITRWTSLSLSKMLAVIVEKGGIEIGFLMFAILGIYDNASEALHGTLYGSTFHIGAFTGKTPSTKNELAKTWNEQFTMLFLMLGTCIHSLIQAVHKVLPIEEIKNRSMQNTREIKNWIPK